MKDISKLVKKAQSVNVLWSIKEFFTIVQDCKKKDFTISFFEEEENWAIMYFRKMPILYLWKKYPLGFIIKEEPPALKNILNKYSYLSLIRVESITSMELRIDDEEVRQDLGLTTKEMGFSLDELWFHTNT